MSRVGLKSIPLPDKVTVSVGSDGTVAVKGPKGELHWKLPQGISVAQEDAGVRVSRSAEDRRLRALHGTARSLIANMMQGVSEGFVKNLEIVGVGFRAAVKENGLDLSVGRSHPVVHAIPDGITVTVADNTKIRIEGIDKQLVGQVAADVRSYYPPEPYKGKGIRYAGEQIRRKAGKSVQK